MFAIGLNQKIQQRDLLNLLNALFVTEFKKNRSPLVGWSLAKKGKMQWIALLAAPKGNRFWEARSSHGANPKFVNPEHLWVACLEYFEWVEDNPLKEAKVAQKKGEPTVIEMDKMRAMTITGLCVFLDIVESTWSDWRANRQDLSSVITRAEQIIRSQKFEGAAADLLNANIIARDLGLAEKKEHSGPDGSPIQTEDVTKRDADAFTRSIAGLVAGSGES